MSTPCWLKARALFVPALDMHVVSTVMVLVMRTSHQGVESAYLEPPDVWHTSLIPSSRQSLVQGLMYQTSVLSLRTDTGSPSRD